MVEERMRRRVVFSLDLVYIVVLTLLEEGREREREVEVVEIRNVGVDMVVIVGVVGALVGVAPMEVHRIHNMEVVNRMEEEEVLVTSGVRGIQREVGQQVDQGGTKNQTGACRVRKGVVASGRVGTGIMVMVASGKFGTGIMVASSGRVGTGIMVVAASGRVGTGVTVASGRIGTGVMVVVASGKMKRTTMGVLQVIPVGLLETELKHSKLWYV